MKQLADDKLNLSNDLIKRLALTEDNLERALTAKKNAHELLVESKEKCSNLENSIAKLRNEKKNLENENNNLLSKLETAQTLLSDVQRKYDIVERDLNKKNCRQDDLKRKQIEERHSAEIEMMQQQMDTLSDKLEKKQYDWESLSARYNALQASQEMMMVEKTNRIKELQNALTEAEYKCEELLNKEDYFEENVRLNKMVASLEQQISNAERTISTLSERLKYTSDELNVMENLLHQHNRDEVSNNNKKEGIQTTNSTDRIASLKHELYRAFDIVKSKRDEIERLKQILEQRKDENKFLREEENKTLVQITTLKEHNIRLENKIKVLEQDIEDREKETKKICSDFEETKKNLKQELEQLKKEHEQDILLKQHKNSEKNLESHKKWLDDAQIEYERLKHLYVEICKENENLKYEFGKIQDIDSKDQFKEHNEKIGNLQRNLQSAELKIKDLTIVLKNEAQNYKLRMKELDEKIEKPCAEQTLEFSSAITSSDCNKCLIYTRTITKLELEQLKLKTALNISNHQIEDLNLKLNEAKSQLKLCEQHEELIIDLKAKAEQFEDYVKAVNGKKNSEVILGVEKANDSENRIRAEIAATFASEMKHLQDCLLKSEQKCITISHEYQQLNNELQQRQYEVDILKQAILAEREKMVEILNQKHLEYTEIYAKKECVLKNCCVVLKEKQNLINDLMLEFKERQLQIEAERKSMKAVMNQWEVQRQRNEVLKAEWEAHLNSMKEQHDQAIVAFQKKYNSAKRTAANYKRYAEDKEIHMLKEYARLKEEYDSSVKKIELQTKETLERKNRNL